MVAFLAISKCGFIIDEECTNVVGQKCAKRSSSSIRCRNLSKIVRSGIATLIMSKKEMEDIMKIVKPLGDSELLIKDVTQKIIYKRVDFLVYY